MTKCEKCNGNGTRTIYADHMGDTIENQRCSNCELQRDAVSDDVQWAEGCDPEMYTDEDGDLVAGNNKYPFWQKKPGEDITVRIVQPDNIVECVNNAGMEDQFDQGVEYIFEGKPGEMITVFDKCGEKRECFADRFKVISTETGVIYHTHKVKMDKDGLPYYKPSDASPGDIPSCPVCNNAPEPENKNKVNFSLRDFGSVPDKPTDDELRVSEQDCLDALSDVDGLYQRLRRRLSVARTGNPDHYGPDTV